MRYHRHGEHPTGMVIFAALLTWGAWKTWHWIDTEHMLVPAIMAFYAALLYLHLAILILRGIFRLFTLRRAMKPTGKAGTAGWASDKELRKSGFFKK